MIFISHLFFRGKWEKAGGRKLPVRMIGFPYLTILGAVLLFSLMITSWFTDFKIMLQFGIPWLLFLAVVYFVSKRRNINHNVMEESLEKKIE
jgi:L-asparagine transporter-like permease